MCSRFPDSVATLLVALLVLTVACGGREPAGAPTDAEPSRVLRVCADPNNLPFSNRKLEGFENRLVEMLARDLDARVEYVWWAQRRGFVRNTLRSGSCDVIAGVPSSFELALATAPYYRSTYVFVSRSERGLELESLDDPALRDLRIGVQLVGDDGATTPPALALARRGITDNVKGFTVYGDYSKPDPPATILDALVEDRIDVALVWGPLAGWYAARSDVPLRLSSVTPEIDLPFLPMVYDISLGVRRDDEALKQELETVLERRRGDIDELLTSYGVPLVETDRMGGA